MKNSNSGKKEQNEIILVYELKEKNTSIRLIGNNVKN